MRGFIRKANGKIQYVKAPDAGNGPGQGTIVEDINADGVATGNYFDADDMSHGFVRNKDGTITEFDAPGDGPQGTTPFSINRAGVVSGYMFDESDGAHGVIGEP
jgi:hypothetical protein